MPLIQEIDYGTPESSSTEQVTLTIDGQEVTVPAGTSIMRAAMEAGIRIPKLCATDSLDAFGSCRVCLCEIEGRAGTPASCTTPVAPGMKVSTTSERVRRVRRGVMELVSDRSSAGRLHLAGRRQQRIPGDGRADRRARGALRPERRQSPACRDRRIQSLFPVRSGALHRVLALRARLRGNAEHLRADHRGARLRVQGRGGRRRAVPDQRMRVLRCLRAGLPDRLAAREDGGRTRPARAFGDHHLRLLRRRLQLQGRDAGRHRGAHGAVEGRQGEPRTFLREGPLRLGLCQSPGPHPCSR